VSVLTLGRFIFCAEFDASQKMKGSINGRHPPRREGKQRNRPTVRLPVTAKRINGGLCPFPFIDEDPRPASGLSRQRLKKNHPTRKTKIVLNNNGSVTFSPTRATNPGLATKKKKNQNKTPPERTRTGA